MCQGSFDRLWAYVTDRFGNRVVGQRVEWEVVSGQLVQLGGADPTLSDVDGNVFNRFAPAGVPGSAVVRATIPGSELSVEFILIATSVRRVRLDTSADAFRSCWNGSAPAVDTIAVGDSLTWELTPFDYDEHQLVTAGDSPLPAEPEFPYAIPTVVTLTFPEPGTYHYRDGYRSATGTLVVR